MSRADPKDRLVLAVVSGLVTLIILFPMIRLLLEAAGPAQEAITAPASLRALGRSLWTASIGAAISVFLGLGFALLVGLTDLRARSWLSFAFLLPLLIPSHVTAIAWIHYLAPAAGGPHPLYSREGIALLLGVEHAPLVFLTVKAALLGLPRNLIEAARINGAGPWPTLRRVLLPLLAPSVAAGAALSFVSSLGNFGIAALLGVPARYPTLPVLVYQRLGGFGPSALGEAAALALMIGLVAMIGVGLQSLLVDRANRRLEAPNPNAAPAYRLGRTRPWAEAGLWTLLIFIVALPLLALLSTALVRAYGLPFGWETLSGRHFARVIGDPRTLRGLLNSMALSAAAGALCLGLGLAVGYLAQWRGGRAGRVLAWLVELPYALPGVVLAIACILAFLRPLPLIGSLYGTVWLILLAYVARFTALALRPTAAAMGQLDRSTEEAAQACGAGLWTRLRRVLLPQILPAALVGGLMVFLTALNELTVSSLLWSRGSETFGVVVYGLEEQGDSTGAAAAACLAVIVVVGLVAAIDRVTPARARGLLPWRG
ncbi:MAG: ABC transporter permease [Elsteraceae bacterium]